nr:hypothetical protein [Tanacetum cinerariifolium]
DEDEREPRFIQAHDPDFVPEPVYPEYIPLEDEHVLPAEEQPLPPVDSPTTESPGYVAESDPEEDLEYEDDEEQDGSVDYPMGEGDDGGDHDGDSSRDDAADEDEDMEEEEEDKEEEEEEHVASADSTAVIPVVELVSSPERTKPDFHALLEDAQDGRSRISQQVNKNSQQVDLLMRDRMTLQETVWTVEEEAYAARLAWNHSIGLSQATYHELQTHRDHVDMRREMSDMQKELISQQEQLRRERQQDRMLDSQITRSSYAENPRNMHTARPCYYADFMKCHPLNFKGTEGAVGLTCWIKKMESVFNISGCAVENQSMLKKKMTDKYCPLGDVKKLEIELWNLKVRNNDIPAYTNRFQELALICTKFVSNETEKVDKYISGLPDNIYGNVKSSKPKTLDETIELANNLMDQKLRHYARDCWSTGNTNATNNRGVNGPNPRGNGYFECGDPGHFKRDCPKLKNKDRGNGNAQGWVYVVGNAERNGNAAGNPDSNVVTGT